MRTACRPSSTAGRTQAGTSRLGPLMTPRTMTSLNLHSGDVPACAQAHLVNPKTDKVPGSDDE
jgi:hypothetical protein